MKVGLTGQDRAPSCSLQRPANSVNLAPTGYTSLFTAAALNTNANIALTIATSHSTATMA